jgi:hypothetical protein
VTPVIDCSNDQQDKIFNVSSVLLQTARAVVLKGKSREIRTESEKHTQTIVDQSEKKLHTETEKNHIHQERKETHKKGATNTHSGEMHKKIEREKRIAYRV